MKRFFAIIIAAFATFAFIQVPTASADPPAGKGGNKERVKKAKKAKKEKKRRARHRRDKAEDRRDRAEDRRDRAEDRRDRAEDRKERARDRKARADKKRKRARRDRDDKLEVCHVPPGNPAATHVIRISRAALDTHLGHGDYINHADGRSCARGDDRDDDDRYDDDDDRDDDDRDDDDDDRDDGDDVATPRY